MVLWIACSPVDDRRSQSVSQAGAQSGERPKPADIDQAGHDRMLASLRNVQARTDMENPWQGEGAARAARRKLAELPANVPAMQLLLTLKDVAYQELRMGNTVEAIELMQRAYELIPQLADRLGPDEVNRIIFRLGVAYFRLGEDQNCSLRHNADSCILPIRGQGVHVDKRGSQEAIRRMMQVLETAPKTRPLALKAVWLMNIAYMTIGGYPHDVPSEYLVPPEVFGVGRDFPRFINIAPSLGVDTFNLFGGMIVDDFTGDGFLDMMTSTFDASGQMRFFRNKRDGTFEDRTTAAGLEGLYGGLNLLQADYDNDGDLDAFVLRGAWLGAEGRHPNSLLRNNGTDPEGSPSEGSVPLTDVTFTDVTFNAGLAKASFPTQTAGWADYDGDGWIDLYIGNEHRDGVIDAPSQLFRNNGVGADGRVTFTDVAAEAGVDNRSFVKGVIWGDYDNDRRPDLYVSTLGGRNRLYHNNGAGADGRVTFTDVAAESGVTGPSDSFASWFFDFDNDGDLDLYSPTYRGVVDGVAIVAASYFGAAVPWELPRMYEADGRGGFKDIARNLGLYRFHQPMGANFGDIDNDGYLDFYLGTGYPDYEALMPNALYHNQEGRAFVDVTLESGFGHLQKGHAIAFADFDHDGDQDVFAQMGGAFPGDRFGDALFENPGFGTHWLTLHLVGRESNRGAIGARLRLEVTEGGTRRTIYKHVNSGGSFGASPLRQTIGLGQATVVQLLEVYWPTTDLTQRFRNVSVDRFYELVEGTDELVALDL